MTQPDLVFADVAVGDELPELVKDVSATTIVLGALATRDWRPMHHDYDFAINRNGVRNIFMNTPNYVAWFERYLTDWTGPHGRMGRIKFRMADSVFPGAAMHITGKVSAAEVDDSGCCWVSVDMVISQEGRTCLTCVARIAVPENASDNPWSRRGDNWRP